ncbi:MAG: hypothetical protein R6V05_14950 [Candidatus Brocadiia bacterium]
MGTPIGLVTEPFSPKGGDMDIAVDLGSEIGELEHFWRSTGFTPAKWLLDDDMQAALACAGSVPQAGIQFVRIHYLLDLIGGRDVGRDGARYNWSKLDAGLDVLTRNGLKPFFELMGNPGGAFSDFTDEAQLAAWRRMVCDLAGHLIARYGRQEVRSWYFESWNEPDIGFGWRQWADDPEPFLRYYDACAAGLADAEPRLRLGGPGSCRTLSELFRRFVAHCDEGISSLTGAAGVPLDFISVHEKGVKSCDEDLTPDSLGICRREARIIEHIRREHPGLADVPFMNNECDPQTGWGHVHTWRARPYYAAIAAKMIHQHMRELADGMGVDYCLLSNDNGFLGTWGNRTLVARFGEGDRFWLVKKPILSLMALLAMLGERRVEVRTSSGPTDLGALATVGEGGQVAVLLYHSSDSIIASGAERVRLALEGLPVGDAVLAHYRLDEGHGDPYSRWEESGARYDLSDEQFGALQECQETPLLEPVRQVDPTDGRLELEFELPLPAVSLVLLTPKPDAAPGRVERLRAEHYAGQHGEQQVMLRWQDIGSRAVRTYEVLHNGERINRPDLIFTAWMDARPGAATGEYSVRAVDWWGRAGEPSESLVLD